MNQLVCDIETNKVLNENAYVLLEINASKNRRIVGICFDYKTVEKWVSLSPNNDYTPANTLKL